MAVTQDPNFGHKFIYGGYSVDNHPQVGGKRYRLFCTVCERHIFSDSPDYWVDLGLIDHNFILRECDVILTEDLLNS
jgi:hypothetical protein